MPIREEPARKAGAAQLRRPYGVVRPALAVVVLSLMPTVALAAPGAADIPVFAWWAAASIAVLAVVGWGLAMALRARRLTAQVDRLRARVQATEDANSQFLTMLSHDLRTPLNGVMGLIALTRQSGLSPRQARLLGEAERSGSGLVNLLRDALDFRDLQRNRAALRSGHARVTELTAAIQQCLADRARNFHLVYGVNAALDLPDLVVGDLARMRQALTYFCVYFAETVKVQAIEVGLRHDGRDLICEMDVTTHTTTQGSWKADHVFGRQADAERPFATDSLAPMIARGLTAMMGGSVTAEPLDDERARLTIRLPAQPTTPSRSIVRIEVRSDTIALLLQSILDEAIWSQWTPEEDAGRVSAVLLEGSAPDIEQTVVAMRAAHPRARLVSLGTPQVSGIFDAVCPMPPGRQSLATALATPGQIDRAAG